ncbi:hypothetical protein, partial [Xanthovirga aplysinae]|uniref:hypothetical protein n=1 Tax=Xanthovirga aplysinae TaxID=2529853 RepID=UPI001657027C
QTIQAYPTSQFAQDYQAAMSGATDDAMNQADGSADSSENGMNSIIDSTNNFFQGTNQFQHVTLSSIVAMQSYYDKFPFVWAQYKDTTYYLYGSDGQSNSFTGQVVMTQPPTLDLTKPNAGYTISFIPASNPSDLSSTDVDSTKAIDLTYSDAVFVNDVNADIPDIALSGMFQLKKIFTGDSDDTKIIPLLSGTVKGDTVIGFDQPQTSDKDAADSSNGDLAFLQQLFEPKSFQDALNSFMLIGGFLMTAHMFAGGLKFIYDKFKEKFGKGEPTTKDDVNTAKDDSDTFNLESATKKQIKTQSEPNAKATPPEELMPNLELSIGRVGDASTVSIVARGIDAQGNLLEVEATFSSVMTAEDLTQFQQLATDLKSLQDSIPSVFTEDASAFTQAVADLSSRYNDFSVSAKGFTNKFSGEVSAAQQESFQQNRTNADEVDTKLEEQEDRVTEEPSEGEGGIKPEEGEGLGRELVPFEGLG